MYLFASGAGIFQTRFRAPAADAVGVIGSDADGTVASEDVVDSEWSGCVAAVAIVRGNLTVNGYIRAASVSNSVQLWRWLD